MPYSVLIALGTNLGDRLLNLRHAIDALAPYVRVVRLSTVIETDPVDAPAGSPRFLNMVIAGYTSLSPAALLDRMLEIETSLGRRRTSVRNAPRIIDLDLILHSAHRVHTSKLTLPHPRFRGREFVMRPVRELGLGWAALGLGARIALPFGA